MPKSSRSLDKLCASTSKDDGNSCGHSLAATEVLDHRAPSRGTLLGQPGCLSRRITAIEVVIA